MSNKAHIRVKTLFDLQNFLARLLNEVRRGECTTDKGKALASISRVLLDCMAKEQEKEILERLAELEKQAGITE